MTMTGIYFTEQATSNWPTATKWQATWDICQVFVCFTKTFSCHTHLSLYSIFWLR